jgi:hypothetical protein
VKLARRMTLPAIATTLLLTTLPGVVVAAGPTVECGQISAYTAPDPIAPADGSLTIGFLPPWTIAADATLGPAAQTNLPSIVNSAPSCLTIVVDAGGVITALDFASSGVVSGSVEFDSGFGGYVFADRLLVPTFITDAYPGLEGIFATSAAAGTSATATFAVDTETGLFTGLSAAAAFCGAGDLAGNGDGLVGAATIPATLLDAADTSALAGADLAHTCATVSTEGTIDLANEGQLTLASVVTITVTPTAPDTSSAADAPRPASPSTVGLVGLLVVGVLVLAATRRRSAGDAAR